MDGVCVRCNICGCEFLVCRKCWRNQKYCSQECSREARRRSRIKSQKKYRESRNGKLKQSQTQQNYRSRPPNKKIVSDHSTKVELVYRKSTQDLSLCSHCGCRIERINKLSDVKSFSIRLHFQI